MKNATIEGYHEPMNSSVTTTKAWLDGEKCYIRARRRPWMEYTSGIKDSRRDIRICLGTFDSVEDTTITCDRAALNIRGPNAMLNFLIFAFYFMLLYTSNEDDFVHILLSW
ncbi:hypothetical protein SUGI_0883190 [Cryptomeria japonica]|nr:hypothetical protein SUGI_0883190 [Cryptomeria japonica]